MGGNALPHIPTRRLPAEAFHRLAADIPACLEEALGIRAFPIPAYRTKPDFGDLDLVVESDALAALEPDAWVPLLRRFAQEHGHARAFKVNAPTRNDHPTVDKAVCSYDHRMDASDEEGFQVDLLLTPAADVAASLAYFSYNDLGNLIGRTAEKMGFTYGHRGLLYTKTEGTRLIGRVEVSRDTDAILEFLGYDAAQFQRGFDTLEDIYRYAASSHYFAPAAFLLENRNHTSRVRDRKRKTYKGFLNYLENHPEVPFHPHKEAPGHWLDRALDVFPGFRDAHRNMLNTPTNATPARSVFTGANVAAWTGLQGRPMAFLMERVKKRFESTEAFTAFVEQEGETGVKAQVLAALEADRTDGPMASDAAPMTGDSATSRKNRYS